MPIIDLCVFISDSRVELVFVDGSDCGHEGI